MKYVFPAIVGASTGVICWMLYLFGMIFIWPRPDEIILQLTDNEAEYDASARAVAERLLQQHWSTVQAQAIGALFPLALAGAACFWASKNPRVFQKRYGLHLTLLLMGFIALHLGWSFAESILPTVGGFSILHWLW